MPTPTSPSPAVRAPEGAPVRGNAFTTYFTYGFTPCEPSEAIGKIEYEDGCDGAGNYFHNVASYRATPKWRRISRSAFRLLMDTTL